MNRAEGCAEMSSTEPSSALTPAAETVLAIKGFDKNWGCRGFQYEIGQTYIMDGPIEACERGFHAIEGHPFEVFNYYTPNRSRYAEVVVGGSLDRHSDDSKVAAASITVSVEIHLHDLVQRAIDWVFARAKPEGESSHATGDSGAASATGRYGAASATGYQGAASATGDHGAASATGDQGRVQGVYGSALFLVRHAEDGEITHAWAGIVGRDGIKPDVWYSLDENGAPQVVS